MKPYNKAERSPNGEGESAPFGQHAQEYLARGWLPFPLPLGEKHPPPVGVTGNGGRVRKQGVHGWLVSSPASNLGVRMPEGVEVVGLPPERNARGKHSAAFRSDPEPHDVIAIDVDHYGDKSGLDTLERLEARLGRLPSGPTISNRGPDSASFQAFALVPHGRHWRGEAGPGLDIIQPAHRYVLGPPSIHPSGRVYRWFDARGRPCAIPNVSALPLLPQAWIDHLASRGHDGAYVSREDGASRAAASDDDVAAFIDAHTEASHPRWLAGLVSTLGERSANGRHATMRNALAQAAKEAGAGLYSAEDAFDRIETWWCSVVDESRHEGEFDRALRWAVAQVDEEGRAAVLERVAAHEQPTWGGKPIVGVGRSLLGVPVPKGLGTGREKRL